MDRETWKSIAIEDRVNITLYVQFSAQKYNLYNGRFSKESEPEWIPTLYKLYNLLCKSDLNCIHPSLMWPMHALPFILLSVRCFHVFIQLMFSHHFFSLLLSFYCLQQTIVKKLKIMPSHLGQFRTANWNFLMELILRAAW